MHLAGVLLCLAVPYHSRCLTLLRGLQLFLASQLEEGDLAEDLSKHMGLFLQKTNIIRDYLEDIVEEPAPRCTPSSALPTRWVQCQDRARAVWQGRNASLLSANAFLAAQRGHCRACVRTLSGNPVQCLSTCASGQITAACLLK